MSFDMEQPLNKAHRYERVAERLLKDERWEEAEQNYTLAAKMMRTALQDVSSTEIALPLKMQAEKFEKMKDIINIKRKEASFNKKPRGDSQQSQNSHLHTGSDVGISDQHKTQTEELASRKSNENTSDKSTGISQISQTMKPKISPPNTWQFVPREIINLIQERETDSLLQFLNFPMNEEENDNLTESTINNKMPKSQEAIIEEYRTRFNAMQTTAIALLKALEDTENENKSLKDEVEGLRLEVSNLNERLMIYEDERNYSPLDFTEADMGEPVRNFTPQKFTNDPMAASMLIGQPENYFKFDGNDIASEIQQAAEDEVLQHKDFNSLPAYCAKSNKTRIDHWGPNLGSMDQSIRYEELDDEVSTEVAEVVSNTTSNTDSHSGVMSPLHYASIAGLPPLSPVHFELDEKDNIITSPNLGDFIHKLS